MGLSPSQLGDGLFNNSVACRSSWRSHRACSGFARFAGNATANALCRRSIISN